MTDDSFADSALTLERLGQMALIAQVPAFAYLGFLLFDDVLFGGIAGLLIGVGTMLHLPYFVRRSGSQDGSAPGGSHADRAAVGLALDAAGIVAFGARFVVDSLLVPLAAAAVIALVLYVPLDRFLPPVRAGA